MIFGILNIKKIPTKFQKLKVVSAIGMFYDLEDPSEFIKHAADALDDDGMFVAQLCVTFYVQNK